MLESEITLFISLLPAATPLRLSLYLAFIFASPSPVCFHTSPPSHRVWLFSPPLFLILHCSWESTGVREGLKHQGKRGWYCILTRLVLFSPSISLLCEAMRDFFFLRLHPPRLTLPPYLPVIMWCRWEVAAAEQVALFLPIPQFFGGGGVCSFIDFALYNKSELQQHKGTGEKKCGMRRQRGGSLFVKNPRRSTGPGKVKQSNFKSQTLARSRIGPASKEFSQLLIIWIPPSPGSTRALKFVQLHWNVWFQIWKTVVAQLFSDL